MTEQVMCPSCCYPHESAHCPNPACRANSSVTAKQIAHWDAEAKRRNDEEAERERVRQIRRARTIALTVTAIALLSATAAHAQTFDAYAGISAGFGGSAVDKPVTVDVNGTAYPRVDIDNRSFFGGSVALQVRF